MALPVSGVLYSCSPYIGEYKELDGCNVASCVCATTVVPYRDVDAPYNDVEPVVAGLKSIDVILNEGLLDNVKSISPYFHKRLHEFNEYEHIGETRGKGLMAALEMVKDKETKEVGLLAQDVDKVLPEATRYWDKDNNDYKSVLYDRLVPLLVESIKEQQQQIDELKEQNKIFIEEIKKIRGDK